MINNFSLDEEILSTLRCPRTGSKLRYLNGKLVNRDGYVYEIKDNIPIFTKKNDVISKREFHESLVEKYSHYEQLKGITGFFYKMYAKKTMNFVNKYYPNLLLDIGGGEGAIFENFNYKRFIVDISMNRLRRNSDKNSLKFCADGMNLPFEDEIFEAVLLIAVLEHVTNPIKMITETTRVLKRGGKVAIVIPNDVSMSIGRVMLGKLPPRSPGHLYFFSPMKIKKMIRNDFKIKTSHYLPFKHLPFWLNMYLYIELEKK